MLLPVLVLIQGTDVLVLPAAPTAYGLILLLALLVMVKHSKE